MYLKKIQKSGVVFAAALLLVTTLGLQFIHPTPAAAANATWKNHNVITVNGVDYTLCDNKNNDCVTWGQDSFTAYLPSDWVIPTPASANGLPGGICKAQNMDQMVGKKLIMTTGGKDYFLDTLKKADTNCWNPDKLSFSNSQPSGTSSDPTWAKTGSTSTTTTGDDTCDKSNSDVGCSNDTLDCGSGAWNWLICPAIQLAMKGANLIDGLIMSQLDVDVQPIFDNTNKAGTPSSGYYQAWSQFRIIATSLLVIAGLVMIVSTALGFEILDAYTLRKTLPRLLVAIIGISLSWPLMRLAVDFFDTVGLDIRSLMYHPFENLGGGISLTTSLLSSATVGVGLFAFGGPALTFIGTAFLAVFVGFLILIIRQAAIIMLIILAPVAIACFILPNTQRVWKLWYENFLGLLLMFPIVSALIAAGHIFAAVTLASNTGNGPTAVIAQAIAIIAYFIVYFMIALAARFATGIIGNIAGFVNDKHKGGFDRLKAVRGNAAKQRHSMRMAGQTKFGSSAVGKHVYRRAALTGTPNSGALRFGKTGRANFNAANATVLQHSVGEILKNDNQRASGDDAAMAAAMKASSGSDFINRYKQETLRQNGTAATDAEARAALALTQSSFGTTMGSAAMQSAAFVGRAQSVTGYSESDAGKKELIEDAGEMVRKGYMTSSDAMAAIKGNKSRLDQSGISFGTGLQAISQAARAPGSINQDNINTLMDTVMDGVTPGSFIGARKESAQAIARHAYRRLNTVLNDPDPTKGANGDINDRRVKKVLGDIAGIQDTINAQAPQMSEVFRASLLTQPIGTGKDGSAIRVRDMIDDLRAVQDSDFNDARKEWLGGASGYPAGQQQAQQQAQQGQQGQPPSDARLKRDIVPLSKTTTGIQLYRFKYLWSDQEYVGVMAQDLIHSHPYALLQDELGFYRVDYSKLGLRMMTIEEWEASQSTVQSVS
jgi:hypothetical protein